MEVAGRQKRIYIPTLQQPLTANEEKHFSETRSIKRNFDSVQRSSYFNMTNKIFI